MPSVDRLQPRAGVISLQDVLPAVPGARASDRAPLAHSHSVTVSATVEYHSQQRAARGPHRLGGKIGAGQNLAIRRAYYEARVVATYQVSLPVSPYTQRRRP